MAERPWHWYLLGDDWDRLQNLIRPYRSKKSNAHQNGSAQQLRARPNSSTEQNPASTKREPDPPNWVEVWSFRVLVLAFLAAAAGAFEAHRLVTATNKAIADANSAATNQLNLAREQEHEQLRAYLAVVPDSSLD